MSLCSKTEGSPRVTDHGPLDVSDPRDQGIFKPVLMPKKTVTLPAAVVLDKKFKIKMKTEQQKTKEVKALSNSLIRKGCFLCSLR